MEYQARKSCGLPCSALLFKKSGAAMPFCRKISEYNSLSPFTQIFFFLFSPCHLLAFAASNFWPCCSILYAKQFSRCCLFISLLWLPSAKFLYVTLFPINYFLIISMPDKCSLIPITDAATSGSKKVCVNKVQLAKLDVTTLWSHPSGLRRMLRNCSRMYW